MLSRYVFYATGDLSTLRQYNNNNNNKLNNNNTQDNVYSAAIMKKSFQEFTRFIWWMWFGASWLPTLRPSQSTWTVSPPVGCHSPHPPSPFIITQPEGWYSFYRPTEGRRLSRPIWLATHRPKCYMIIFAMWLNCFRDCTMVNNDGCTTAACSVLSGISTSRRK